MVAAFNDEFAPYEVEKSTIRFPFTTPVPERLIQRITLFRISEIAKTRPADSDEGKHTYNTSGVGNAEERLS